MAEKQEKSIRGGLDLAGTSDVEARRAFLKGCAKYAVAMPPAVTLLLSASPTSSQDTNANCSVICANPGQVHPPCVCPGGDGGGVGTPPDGNTNGLSQEDIEYLQNQ